MACALSIFSMKISILGSGSEGNATYICLDGVALMVDAGFSGKALIERFAQIDVDPTSLKALLVTHEHIDHIKGVGIISRKFNLPIYITPESYRAGKHMLGKIDPCNLKMIEGEFSLLDTVKVIPFDVNHDAARTVGFRFEGASGKTVVVTTDIGSVTTGLLPYFTAADVVVLESNYDFEMLQTCDYPYHLKRRINSSNGHLSNIDFARMVEEVYHPNLKRVYLAHISKNSNTYDLALSNAQAALAAKNIEVNLEVAFQNFATPIFEV